MLGGRGDENPMIDLVHQRYGTIPMQTTTVPRLFISGTGSEVGKSLVVTGLLLALRRKGLSVSCVVVGPALQQSVMYHRILRRYSRCLDTSILSPEQVCAAVGQAGRGADIVLIDGTRGLYDEVPDGGASLGDAALARMLGAPVVMVVDVPTIATSMAAVVRGFVEFPNAPRIEAIVANRVQGHARAVIEDTRHELQRCEELMRTYGLPTCVGCIPEVPLKGSLPRSVCFQEKNYTAVPLQLLNELENLIATHVQVDELVTVAGTSQPFEFQDVLPIVPRGECRIAVADDSCFGFCFQDNIDLLRLYGAEVVSFSPLADSGLPRSIGGVYIPGAYLAEYGETISANKNLHRALREFCDAGGVLYSEGAGTAFLCKTFRPRGSDRTFEGVGLIPAHAVEQQSPGHHIVRASISEDSVLGNIGSPIAGLAINDWQIKGREIGLADRIVDTLRIESRGGLSAQEGYSVSGQSCSTLHFLHFGSNPEFAHFLVLAAATHQKTGAVAPRLG